MCLNIALICTEKLPVPPIRGGAIQVLIGVIPHLSKRHYLTIFCIRDSNLPDRELEQNVEFIRVPKENYPFHVAMELANKRANHEIFDLVHVFNRPQNLLFYKNTMPEARFVLSLHNEMFKKEKISRNWRNWPSEPSTESCQSANISEQRLRNASLWQKVR
jgi:hypothetical protein